MKIFNVLTSMSLVLSIILSLTACNSGETGSQYSDFTSEYIIEDESSKTDDISSKEDKKDKNETSSDKGKESSKENKEENSSKEKVSSKESSSEENTSSEPEVNLDEPDAKIMDYIKEIREMRQESLGVTDKMLSKSIMNEGNMSWFAPVFKKAMNGDSISIVTIGGSITAGATPSSPATCFGPKVARWWTNTFNITVNYQNAGIGATQSNFGVYRMAEDVLKHKPDLVIIEYAVNDNSPENDYCNEEYEAIIRNCLENGSAVILYMMGVQGGDTCQDKKVAFAEHYDIPAISYKNAFYGTDIWNSFYSGDPTHPNDKGHDAVTLQLIYYFEKVYKNFADINKTVPKISSSKNASSALYKNARLVRFDELKLDKNVRLKDTGAFLLDSETSYIGANWHLKAYTAKFKTEPLVFEVDDCNTFSLLTQMATANGSIKVTVKSSKGETEQIIDTKGSYDSYVLSHKIIDKPINEKVTVWIEPLGTGNVTIYALGIS